mmetsp:Transcript_39672/g.125249  ORF Transcript_39672/g.125249 Transcript_39672/m.125249 type:complete len:225 (+) Transcript_39672:423-1097(+)
MIAIRSARSSASSRKCVVSTTVRPCRCSRSSAQMARRECGSMPEVGSSRKRVREPPSSATARHSLRFWPPESAPARTLARSCSPTRCRARATSTARSPPLSPRSRPKSVRCCVGESSSQMVFTCWQTPIDVRMARSSAESERPSMVASPAVGGTSPVSIEIVVVFPAPLEPSRQVMASGGSCSESPSTATPRGYSLRSERTTTPRSESGAGSGSTTGASSRAGG